MDKKKLKYLSVIIFAAVALFLIFVGGKQVWEQSEKIRYYKPINAEILSSEVVAENPDVEDTNYRPNVTYSYEVDGKIYHSDVVTPVYKSGEYAWAKKISDSYQVGTEYLAYYDPQNPENSFLRQEFTFSPYLTILFAMIFVVFVVSVIILDLSAWQRKRAERIPGDWKEIFPERTAQDQFRTFFYITLLLFVVGFLVLGHYFWFVEIHESFAYKILGIYGIAVVVFIFQTIKYWKFYKETVEARLFVDKLDFSGIVKAKLLLKYNSDIKIKELRFGLACFDVETYQQVDEKITQFTPRFQEVFTLLNNYSAKKGGNLTFEKEFQLPEDSVATEFKERCKFQVIEILEKGIRNLISF